MAIPYLGGKWEQITREERYFCAEFFYEIRKDLLDGKRFLLYLKENGIEINLNEDWEAGFEVCFYRDFLKYHGFSGEKAKRFSLKRTFDIVLFSESTFIIIEAKAFEGFDNNQLPSFDSDRDDVKRAISYTGTPPKIYILALTSKHYSMKPETKAHFDLTLNWGDLERIYKNPIFQTADSLKVTTYK